MSGDSRTIGAASPGAARPPRRAGNATRLLALLAGLAAIAGVAAIWAGVGTILRGPVAWMALLVALDAALLLRLAGMPAGRERAAFGVAIVAATIIAGGYLYAAAQVGLVLGLRPSESVLRMSPGLAWLYLRANVGALDALWLAAGVALGWRACR